MLMFLTHKSFGSGYKIVFKSHLQCYLSTGLNSSSLCDRHNFLHNLGKQWQKGDNREERLMFERKSMKKLNMMIMINTCTHTIVQAVPPPDTP